MTSAIASERYKKEMISENKDIRISSKIDADTNHLLNKYLDFLYNQCSISKKSLPKDKIINDLLKYSLNKFETSKSWKTIIKNN